MHNAQGIDTVLPHNKPEPDVRKIAVLRANGLGDLIFALPALEALRAAYPAAEIVLLAKKWHVAFLEGRPGPVDRTLAIPHVRGVSADPAGEEDGTRGDASLSAELERFFQAMARERFDLAVQVHGGGRYSNPFVRNLGARLTLGLKTPDAAPLDRWVPYIYFQNEILRYLEVVALAGAAPVVLEPRLTVTAEDLAEARRVVPDDGRPLVVLHPGAGDARRRWPPEKFAAVGAALAAAGAQVVLTGTAEEQDLGAAVVEAMAATATATASNLCARLSLGGLAGLLSRCRVVVSNDSGPLHLAGAVGAATVGIYWGLNLINAGPPTRTRHRPLLSWRVECPVCGRNMVLDPCAHRSSLVADVPQEEVIAAALDLFAQA